MADTADKSDDGGLGCIVVIALTMITVGAWATWGPGSLLVIGGIIIAIIVIG